MSVNGLAARPAPPTAGIKQSTPPNQTLYVNNLADKVHKDDMIRSLYLLFSAQAHILDVVVMKTGKTRGQAHVVFEDQFAATQAMRALQGVEFLGKPIRIQYAKGKSKIVAALDGSAASAAAAAKRSTAPSAPTSNAATDLQKQVFGGPLAGGVQVSTAGGTGLSVPNRPPDAPSPQGTKRAREDDSDDEGAPMEEDDDGDAAMDVSDDD